jgi:adenosylcobinamide-GDP ribazoletransferase
MRGQLRAFVAAVQFLTRIPVPAPAAYDPADLARSTPYFPAVGLIVGVFGAGVYQLAALGWPPFVAATLAVVGTILFTGAFHEDALADAFDGFGGGWNREQVLAIMKDSRVGSYGAVAVAVAVVLKVGTLAALAPGDVVRALVVGHVVARWSSLPLIWWFPYVRETPGTGKPFAASVTPGRLAAGTAVTILIAAVAVGGQAFPVLAIGAIVVAACGRYFKARIGGITGDCLGAANQLVEVATYLTLAFRSAS